MPNQGKILNSQVFSDYNSDFRLKTKKEDEIETVNIREVNRVIKDSKELLATI